jgi:polar amino acid transport system substrate-binding protein
MITFRPFLNATRALLLLTALPALLAAGLSAGCATVSAPQADPGLLRVGVAPNSPPMIFKQGDRYAGLEADFARALANELGRKAVFVEFPWEKLLPALEEGKIDVVMSNMSITQLRALRVDFANPYLSVGQMALIHRSDTREFPFGQAVLFTQKTIGVDKGTTGDLFVQERCRQATRETFSSPDKAVAALLQGKIDVFIHDAPVIWRLAAEHEADGLIALSPPLTKESLAWAFPVGQGEMRDAANDVLERWTTSGQLQRMIETWLPAVTR